VTVFVLPSFEGISSLHLQGRRDAFTLKIENAVSSEIFVNIY
jgi:hypothetical protein